MYEIRGIGFRSDMCQSVQIHKSRGDIATEAVVLANHGITGDNLTDAARAAGLIYACLGCGTVGGIDVDAPLGDYVTVEDARMGTRNALLSWDALDCCNDATTVVY